MTGMTGASSVLGGLPTVPPNRDDPEHGPTARRLAGWSAATRWLAGTGALEAIMATASVGNRPVLVVDAGAVATRQGAALERRLRTAVGRDPVDVVTVDRPPTFDQVRAMSARWHGLKATGIVAIGGGATMDLAALGALPTDILATPRLASGRCGLVLLPSSAQAAILTVMVPTTLGTGAEVSPAACCDHAGDKLLILSEALRPRYAAVEPLVTASLPRRQVADAVVEVLARILVPFTAVPTEPHPSLTVADAVALASLESLATLLARAVDSGFDDDFRIGLATVGAHSHAGWGNIGRNIFASPLWFVATEVSTVLGLSKAWATRLCLPVWAASVIAGDRRWGEDGRLSSAWNRFRHISHGGRVREARTPINVLQGPTYGLSNFLDALYGDHDAGEAVDATGQSQEPQPDLVRRPDPGIVDVIADRLHRRWGAGLPMLGRFTHRDLQFFVTSALAEAAHAKSSGTALRNPEWM
ncbi:iron-containing alcohol dehydrogenase [Frankia sp. Cppng1_Ct_nod]|uniref:iron-containing alcohol dehydrogenase n=1 Tax=Frankia sp. Cppng1_Ct_nod TaxID=2897162 RepID=UPI001040E1A6|nr:iron-containing alcohol dehydrogenase [Frankia sp. Cppng1_Ct_nod]